MSLRDFLLFGAVAVGIGIATHSFVRRYWLAVLLSAFVSSLANIAHEVFTQDFAVRPSDVVFWLPMLLVEGMVVALPFVTLIGVPFYGLRRRRKADAAS